MRFTLPTIYPITDQTLAGLSHLEQMRRLHAGDATMIQLREKSASAREFYDAAAECSVFCREVGIKLIVNDRVDIAIAVGADGVHLGQDDLPPERARRLMGDDAIIGFSTHSIEQARAAITLPIDYIAIGPIFATSTKKEHDPVVGLDGLCAVRDSVGDFPLVAIGGIKRANAADVLEAGADTVALISELIADPGLIADRMREFTKIESARANDVGNA